MTFLFPFPSNSHRIISIPIPTHSHSHSDSDYLKAEKYVYCVVNTKQNIKSPLISHHHYNCLSLFTVQRLSDCHCMLLCKNSRLFTLSVGIFIKYAIPIPIRTISILISSPKLLPFPWEYHGNFHGNGNSHCHAHL